VARFKAFKRLVTDSPTLAVVAAFGFGCLIAAMAAMFPLYESTDRLSLALADLKASRVELANAQAEFRDVEEKIKRMTAANQTLEEALDELSPKIKMYDQVDRILADTSTPVENATDKAKPLDDRIQGIRNRLSRVCRALPTAKPKGLTEAVWNTLRAQCRT
jgi:predicted transcriptional regulator